MECTTNIRGWLGGTKRAARGRQEAAKTARPKEVSEAVSNAKGNQAMGLMATSITEAIQHRLPADHLRALVDPLPLPIKGEGENRLNSVAPRRSNELPAGGR